MESLPEKLHYSKSPLTEAVLEIKNSSIKPEQELFEGLHKVYRGLKKNYPNSSKLYSGNVGISTGSTLDTQVSQKAIGYKYTTQDNIKVVQTRLDGFSFHRLAPYDRWENFRDEAKIIWGSYRKIIKPDNIVSLSLRYINQINLPTNFINLGDYFLTVPQISKLTPEAAIAAYFYQVIIPQPSIATILLINQFLRPIEYKDPTTIPIVFDIQLVRELNVPQSEEEIWAFFDVLRVRKNEVFEASITDKTRELIK